MNIESSNIKVNGLRVRVVRKAIKNLHLGVYPPNGRVRVAVPQAVTDAAVRLAVIRKLGWIKRQQARFEAQPRQSKRDMISGESHYFLGRRYRLRVIPHEGAAEVALRNKSGLELHVRLATSTSQRERVLRRWYRDQMRILVPPLLGKWQKVLDVQVPKWGIKRMKTKWGSCNREAKRIWLNLELAKKPIHCLEYIIVHEMAHLVERTHSERFVALMDKFLPQWRFFKEELSCFPISHTDWSYQES